MATSRPNATLTPLSGWMDNFGNQSDLHSPIDEVVLDLADWIECPGFTIGGDPDFQCEIGFSAIPDPGVDTGHVLRIWMELTLIGGAHTIRVEMPNITGASWDIAQNTSDGLVQHNLTLTSGQAAVMDYSLIYTRITRLHDGTDFLPKIYKMEFETPSGFSHLDISSGGVIVASALSGHYLSLFGGGLTRVSGTEINGAIILDGAGWKVKS